MGASHRQPAWTSLVWRAAGRQAIQGRRPEYVGLGRGRAGLLRISFRDYTHSHWI